MIAPSLERVEKVCIWTPDKDLAQCVRGDRVVQMDRRSNKIRDEAAVREKFETLWVEASSLPFERSSMPRLADGPGFNGSRSALTP